MSANDRQVGGSHYAAELQHWDMIEDHGIGYLEGCASKYASRWRKKNGVQDLEKGLHYTEKLVEKADYGSMQRFPRGEVPTGVIAKFVIANDLELKEHAILLALLRWRVVGDLRYAVRLFQQLIQEATNDPTPAVRADVNLDATGDGEPAGLDLSKAGCCGCGDERHPHQDTGDRS